MAATGTPTPNIGLRRAQGTDPASVDDINYNSALIDTKLGAVGNSSVQDQIDTLKSNLTNKMNKSDVANNLTTTGSGKVLDARQGKALNDKFSTMNTDTSVSGLTMKKCGNIVFGYLSKATSSNQSGTVVIATIPAGYRPPVTFATIEVYERGTVQIGTDGKITLYGTIAGHTYAVSFAYPITA